MVTRCVIFLNLCKLVDNIQSRPACDMVYFLATLLPVPLFVKPGQLISLFRHAELSNNYVWMCRPFTQQTVLTIYVI